MKKCFYINFNVGSGIEYTGNTFLETIKKKYDVYEYKLQNPSCVIIEELVKASPDVIIINEMFLRAIEAAYFYKRVKPETRVVQICHDWKNIFDIFNEKRLNDSNVLQQYYLNKIDRIVLLNFKPNELKWPTLFNTSMLVQAYFPIDETFRIKTPWSQRKNFCFIGNISNLRLTKEFLEQLKDFPEIEIDIYGKKVDLKDKEYYSLFDGLKNINYLGELEQKDVSNTLNKYKYFIMAHSSESEVFFITLLQAIFCGTIPLISNDRLGKNINYKWIDWANGFYFGCNKEKELLKNIAEIVKNNPDSSELSKDIYERASKKFSMKQLKSILISAI